MTRSLVLTFKISDIYGVEVRALHHPASRGGEKLWGESIIMPITDQGELATHADLVTSIVNSLPHVDPGFQRRVREAVVAVREAFELDPVPDVNRLS